jgi:hypothetical protein
VGVPPPAALGLPDDEHQDRRLYVMSFEGEFVAGYYPIRPPGVVSLGWGGPNYWRCVLELD